MIQPDDRPVLAYKGEDYDPRIPPVAAMPNGLVLEWDQNPNAIREELLREPLQLESDGTIKAPERPGLGIELDRGHYGTASRRLLEHAQAA